MNKIKIADGDEFLSFDLVDILICIKSRVIIYNWAILDIYCTSKNKSNFNILNFEKQVNSKKNLFVLDFEGLLALSTKINQTIDGIFIASKNNLPPNKPNTTKLEQNFDVVIEVIDSSYWTVYSKDSEIIKLLKDRFNNTEIIF